jgi:hypothetical protein
VPPRWSIAVDPASSVPQRCTTDAFGVRTGVEAVLDRVIAVRMHQSGASAQSDVVPTAAGSGAAVDPG